MAAIIKREFNAYFRSPLGYVFIAVYLFFSGTYFTQVLTSGMASLFPQIYYGMFSIILLLLPLLTMRLMSEDKKLKTDQLLLTSPVSVPGLVLGKFIAALSVYPYLRRGFQPLHRSRLGAYIRKRSWRNSFRRSVYCHRYLHFVPYREYGNCRHGYICRIRSLYSA